MTRHDIDTYIANHTIMQRAQVYADDDRVLNLDIIPAGGTRVISAEVRGSGFHTYSVHAVVGRQILTATCTCPYPAACKHIGAVLLVALERGLPHSGPGADGGVLARNEAPVTPGLRILSAPASPAADDYRRNHSRDVLLLPSGADPAPGSHRLVYVVEADADSFAAEDGSPTVRPMLRYVRTDGTDGALSPWRPGRSCVARSRGEIDALDAFARRPGRRISLSALIVREQLGQELPPLWIRAWTDGDPPGPPPGDAPLCRVRHAPLAEVVVRFRPFTVTAEDVLFAPELTIAPVGTTSATDAPADAIRISPIQEPSELEPRADTHDGWRGAAATQRRRVFEPRSSSIQQCHGDELTLVIDFTTGLALWTADVRIQTLLRTLAGPIQRPFAWSETAALAAEWISAGEGSSAGADRSTDRAVRVHVQIPPDRVQVSVIPATPEVHVDFGEVLIALGDENIPAPWVEDGDPPVLHVAVRDTRSARAHMDALTERCLNLLESVSPWEFDDRRIVCDGNVPEILACIAEPMLDAGVPLIVEGRRVRAASVTVALRVTGSGEDWFGVGMTLRVVRDDGIEEEVAAADIDGAEAVARDTVMVLRNHTDLEDLRRRVPELFRGELRVHRNDIRTVEELASAPGVRMSPDLAGHTARARELRAAWRDLAAAMPDLDHGEPPGFGTTLRPYQRRGLAWLVACDAAGFAPLLADDMGLGKTVQLLALLQLRATEGTLSSGGQAVLVVAPPSTLENWKHETVAFAPALEPVVYHGPGRAALLQPGPVSKRCRVLVTSYQTLMRDVDRLETIDWRYLVFDEIQTIKNARTRTYQAARRVAARAGQRVALSGTPVENTSLELFAVEDLLNPGLLGTRAAFTRRFAEAAERDESPERRASLRELLSPLILRRRKTDVATDLPARDEIPLYVALSDSQARIYERVRATYERRVREAMESGKRNQHLFLILEGLTRMRQAAVDPRLLLTPDDDSPPADARHTAIPGLHDLRIPARESAKTQALQEFLPRVIDEGHRVLIFSQFVALLNILTAWADREAIPFCLLHGGHSPAQRRDEIARFQAPEGPPVFFISLRAGGTGINLTAADYVILMDPWWNPAVEQQAIDRSHRIGQTKPVTAYRFIAAGTVEERIASLQARKRALAEEIVPDDARAIGALSDDDVIALFSGGSPGG